MLQYCNIAGMRYHTRLTGFFENFSKVLLDRYWQCRNKLLSLEINTHSTHNRRQFQERSHSTPSTLTQDQGCFVSYSYTVSTIFLNIQTRDYLEEVVRSLLLLLTKLLISK
jgi:hypothetical protein